jgi:diguanylate cyclase (GGDEF)-like protein
MISNQVVDMLNMGVVILDADLRIRYWNIWMAMHSGLDKEKVVGRSLIELFPDLNNPLFLRSVKSVLAFGNYYFFSQKLHRYLIPMKTSGAFPIEFGNMQQNGAAYPIRDENNAITHICITIQDVTEVAAYEKILMENNLKDSLTGAYNRRFLTARLTEEFERRLRYARSLSLMMLDIDHFKAVNDTYGHQCGDAMLKAVCETISVELRKLDMLVRYGGEEFCCLLPETDLPSALSMAERIRKTIASREFVYKDARIRMTVSIGVYELCADIDSPETLLRMADEALYKAKETGRNRVFSYSSRGCGGEVQQHSSP